MPDPKSNNNSVEDLFNGDLTYNDYDSIDYEQKNNSNNKQQNYKPVSNVVSHSVSNVVSNNAEQITTNCVTEKYSEELCVKKSMLETRNKFLELCRKGVSIYEDDNLKHKVPQKQYSNHFNFPTYTDVPYCIKGYKTNQELQQTLQFLGNDLCDGYNNVQNLYDLETESENIIKFHRSYDQAQSMYVFVNNKFLKYSDSQIEKLDFEFVICGYKGKKRKFTDEQEMYLFTTLSNKELNKDKIIVVINQIINSQGKIRDINIGYTFLTKFYQDILYCPEHNEESCGFNCYNVYVLKRENIVSNAQQGRGSFEKYKIEGAQMQQDYVKNMFKVTKNRIIENVKVIKNSVNRLNKK